MTSQVLSEQLSTAPVQAFIRLLQGHAAATRELSANLVRDHGLTINDYEALLRLSRADGNYLKRVELAESLVLTPSGVTRLLDGLERAGSSRRARATPTRESRTRYSPMPGTRSSRRRPAHTAI